VVAADDTDSGLRLAELVAAFSLATDPVPPPYGLGEDVHRAGDHQAEYGDRDQ
jgi:hypothetical protein